MVSIDSSRYRAGYLVSQVDRTVDISIWTAGYNVLTFAARRIISSIDFSLTLAYHLF